MKPAVKSSCAPLIDLASPFLPLQRGAVYANSLTRQGNVLEAAPDHIDDDLKKELENIRPTILVPF